MRSIAAAIAWGSYSAARRDCAALLSATPYRFSGSPRTARFPAGAVGFRAGRAEPETDSFWVDEAAQVAVVIDARLHNRSELTAELGRDASVSDAQLVALAYARWHGEFVSRLIGDFSLVLCDWRTGDTILATGPNASRTLFFVAEAERLFVASDPEQLQVLRPFRAGDVDPRTVLDFLDDSYGDAQRTFYRHVRRVVPGVRTSVSRRGQDRQQFFFPQSEAEALGTDEEYLAEFARIFRRCVADSVRVGQHHLVHLSGGLDSSSIVGALNEIPPDGRTTLDTITAIFPTLASCNERAAVAAVQRRVRFGVRNWNAEILPEMSDEVALCAWPPPVASTAIGNFHDVDMAGEGGSVAVISGAGGDSLTLEIAAITELVRRRRWRTLWNQLGAQGFSSRARRFLAGVALAEVKRPWTARTSTPRSNGSPPGMLGPELSPLRQEPGEPGGSYLPTSHADALQEQVWNYVTHTTNLWVTETIQMRAFRAGVEVCSPYHDQRLVAFVASIPFERRLPNGRLRRLQREGLADLLPREVLSRPKTVFDPATRRIFVKEKPHMQATCDDGTWLSAPFVDRAWASATIQLAESGNDPKMRRLLRRVWSLELWLRRNLM